MQYLHYLASLAIYRNILHDSTIAALLAWLRAKPGRRAIMWKYVTGITSLLSLVAERTMLPCHLLSLIIEDDNVFSQTAENRAELGLN